MDSNLVLQAQHGDERAFAELAYAMGGRLFALAHRILRDVDLAEEATQQTIVDIWRELPTLRQAERFESWAFRMIVNACYRETRRARRLKARVHLLAVHEPEQDPARWVADRDELERAFRRLPVEQRAVLVLQYHLGLSMDGIADHLGIAPGTVRSRIHHAKRALRAAIEADARSVGEGQQA
jgi:RNA polymerase sigma factor (sigma-70 family)